MQKINNFVKSPNDVCETLVDYFPQYLLKDAVINEFGWRSIVADLKDSLICNFPRDVEKFSKLHQEKDIVGILKNTLAIELPNRLEIKNARYPFFLHRKIKGDYFDVKALNMVNKKDKYVFLDSVSDFFILFHSINPKPLIQNKVIQEYNILFDGEETILGNLTQYFSQDKQNDIKAILSLYKREVKKDTEKVFCYNDFHGYNIVVDECKKLKGVFDFDKVAVNNRILDLRKITLNYGWNVGLDLLNIYNSKTDKKIDVEKFKLYTVASHLCEFSWMHEIDTNILRNIKSVNFSRHIDALQLELLKMRER